MVAEARAEATRVDYESSRQLHERQQELYDIGSLSTVALEESSYASIRMESAYRLARAELELARYNLDKTSMRAPFDAWIIDKRVFVGQSLSTKQIIPVSYVVAPVGGILRRSQPVRMTLHIRPSVPRSRLKLMEPRVPERFYSRASQSGWKPDSSLSSLGTKSILFSPAHRPGLLSIVKLPVMSVN